MNGLTTFFTEFGKLLVPIVTPLVLIISVVLQVREKRAAEKRGKEVQEAADRAQSAANEAQHAATDAAKKAAQVAVKTEDVRQTLVKTDSEITTKLDSLAVQTDKVHTLVNSNMGLQLKSTAMFARRVAEMARLEAERTGTAEDRAAADQDDLIAKEHERLSVDHEMKQSKVDEKEESEGKAEI